MEARMYFIPSQKRGIKFTNIRQSMLKLKTHNFIMILLSIYIYNWIGNKFLQLTSPSPYEYINSINKTHSGFHDLFRF